MHVRSTTRLVLGLSLAAMGAPALAGPLDPPPGPVGPTMKPLDEVEPRIPIDRLPYTISISGSYYLTESLVGVAGEVGILVRARRVTIDLNGFELRGAAGTLDAIQVIEGITPCADLVVRNGAIFGWERVGINASCVSGSVFEDLRIEGNTGFAILAADFAVARNVRVQDNGSGIEFGVGSLVENVVAAGNRDDGIGVDTRSIVLNSSAINNQGIGVRAGPRCVIENVTASGNTAVGVRIEAGSTATRVTSEENGNIGIALNGKGVVVDSIASNNTPTGILAFAGSRIERCAASDNTMNGIVLNGPGVLKDNTLVDNPTQILLNGDGSRVEGNDISGGTTGVKGAGTGNLVVRSIVRGAKTPFDLAPGNLLGPVSTTMTDHPWANFTDE